MILPGSYANGFAPRDGQPLYPELWRGCVGAWSPCLGPTGLTLRDCSGYHNHGTLENMAAASCWTPSNGRWALEFDGTNDRVTTGSASESLYDFSDATSRFTIAMWAMDRSSTARSSIVMAKGTAASAAGGYYVDLGQDFSATDATQGFVSLYFGSGRWTGVNFPVAANVLQHIAIVVDMTLTGTDRCEVYVNGIRSTGIKFSQNPLTALAANSNPITIGNATTNNLPFNGLLHEISIYQRALTRGEISILAIKPRISYELAPRRRSSSAVQFNRRRRLLVGASL